MEITVNRWNSRPELVISLFFALSFVVTPMATVAQDTILNEPRSAQHYLDSARETAGDQWRATVDFLCGPDPDPGNAAESAVMKPTQLFDNLYAFGRSKAVVYALTTDEGIILIDAGYPDQVESVLAPGLRELGLNADDIRYVIVAHGHRDHYGGSRHLQQQHGASVVLSAADWEFMDQYRTDSADDVLGQPPERDVIAEEGVPIVLGDTAVTPVMVPGHTPGSLGLIFTVRDGDEEHVAGLFGGTILISSRISDEGLQQYLSSIEHYAAVARDMGVDVEIQNHPIIDNMDQKLQQLESRAAGAPHPFVVGNDEYQNFLGVISECTLAEVARRAEG
jgi:metallo-beta-lactamase class B